MKQTHPSPPGSTTHFPPARTALRSLYRAARHIRFADPYAGARLARIADQAEYFLQQWPTDEWPASLAEEAAAVPPRAVLLAWVATAKREAAQLSARPPGIGTHASWQQITTTLLAALVPFA